MSSAWALLPKCIISGELVFNAGWLDVAEKRYKNSMRKQYCRVSPLLGLMATLLLYNGDIRQWQYSKMR